MDLVSKQNASTTC